jgi:hypothetical protein
MGYYLCFALQKKKTGMRFVMPLVVLITFLLTLSLYHKTSAFLISSSSSPYCPWILEENLHLSSGCPARLPSTILLQSDGSSKKRKRRRRPMEEDSASNINGDDDELPSFELLDDKPAAVSDKSSVEKISLSSTSDDFMDVPKGGSNPSVDIKDLIASRDTSLESTFEFDPVVNPLPRLGDRSIKSSAKSSTVETNPDSINTIDNGGSNVMGKKRARDMARQAAAAAAAAEKESEDAKKIFSKLPFIGKMMQEKQTPVKVRCV